LLGIEREEGSFVAALLRMTGKRRRRKEEDGEGKKKQVPHPSALRAYGLRMTAKSDCERQRQKAKGKGRRNGKRPPLKTEGSGTRKGSIFSAACEAALIFEHLRHG